MLKLLALPLLFVGSFAMADEVQFKMPAAIKCTSNAVSKLAQKFTVTKLDTDRPEAFGQSSMEPFTKTYVVSVDFSDECESAYGIVIMGEDLQKLRDGKVKSVKGLLNYANEDLDMSRPENEEQSTETVIMNCTLAK